MHAIGQTVYKRVFTISSASHAKCQRSRLYLPLETTKLREIGKQCNTYLNYQKNQFVSNMFIWCS